MDNYLLDLSPFAIRFGSGFGIRWYGLAYLTGFLCGYLIIRTLTRRNLAQVPEHKISDLIFALALGTVVGGRLGYCLFYDQSLLTRFSPQIPFWGVLAIHEGGMASHGGILGLIAASWLYGRKHNLNSLHLLDLATLGGTLGVFFGRIANFVNGELVGRPISTPLAWAVKFPQDILAWPYYSPEKLSGLTPVIDKLGVPVGSWISWVQDLSWNMGAVQNTLFKIIEEVQTGNSAVANALKPLLEARHPSQLYEAVLEGLFIFTCLILIWRRPQKPGVISWSFAVIYSIVRIIGEQFRMPDAQIGFQLFGLTRGQWLSIAMLGASIVLLTLCMRRNVPKIGGWGYARTNKA